MTQAHSRTVDTEAEVIEILVAISQVSARMARNLSVLAARQSEEGGNQHLGEECTFQLDGINYYSNGYIAQKE